MHSTMYNTLIVQSSISVMFNYKKFKLLSEHTTWVLNAHEPNQKNPFQSFQDPCDTDTFLTLNIFRRFNLRQSEVVLPCSGSIV